MAPDADAGKSPNAPTLCAADIGAARRRRRPRYLCREHRPPRRHSRGLSAWRARQRLPARSSPAVRPRAFSCGPVRPARRRPQPPQGTARGQHTAASDRGHGDDPRKIRLRSLDDRRRLLGRDAGAGLCAGPSRPRHRHRAARHLPRHASRKSKTDFSSVLPRIYPGLHEDFLSVLPAEERAQPIDAYFRRILDPDSAVHGPAARAWGETESILSEHTPNRGTARSAALNSSRALPATPFMEAHYFANHCFMQPNQLMTRPASSRHSRHHRAGPLRSAMPAGDIACAGRGVARGRDPYRRRRRPYAIRSRRPRRRDESDRGHGFENECRYE